MAEHVNLQDPKIHETKGASTATEGQFLRADGLGNTAFTNISIDDISDINNLNPLVGSCVQGSYKYADSTTPTTPIDLTVAGVDYPITADGTTSETIIEYGIPGLVNIWDTETNRLVFSGTEVLGLGDTLDVLVELTITTTGANTAVSVHMDLDADGAPFRLDLVSELNYKAAGTYSLDAFTPFFMKSQAILDGSGLISVSADDTGASVVVRGIFVRVWHTVRAEELLNG